mgnify:CR=1 FL=1
MPSHPRHRRGSARRNRQSRQKAAQNAMTDDQLTDKLRDLKKAQFNLRFQQATGQLENTAGIKAARRNAARVKTILNEKAAAAASEE